MCRPTPDHGAAVNHVWEAATRDEVEIELHGSCPHEVQANGFEDAVNVVGRCSSIARLCHLCQSLSAFCMSYCVHCIVDMLCWRAYDGVGLTNLRSRSLSRSRSIVVIQVGRLLKLPDTIYSE